MKAAFRTAAALFACIWYGITLVGIACWWGLALMSGRSLRKELDEIEEALK
jgi:hypothetical protein